MWSTRCEIGRPPKFDIFPFEWINYPSFPVDDKCCAFAQLNEERSRWERSLGHFELFLQDFSSLLWDKAETRKAPAFENVCAAVSLWYSISTSFSVPSYLNDPPFAKLWNEMCWAVVGRNGSQNERQKRPGASQRQFLRMILSLSSFKRDDCQKSSQWQLPIVRGNQKIKMDWIQWMFNTNHCVLTMRYTQAHKGK